MAQHVEDNSNQSDQFNLDSIQLVFPKADLRDNEKPDVSQTKNANVQKVKNDGHRTKASNAQETNPLYVLSAIVGVVIAIAFLYALYVFAINHYVLTAILFVGLFISPKIALGSIVPVVFFYAIFLGPVDPDALDCDYGETYVEVDGKTNRRCQSKKEYENGMWALDVLTRNRDSYYEKQLQR